MKRYDLPHLLQPSVWPQPQEFDCGAEVCWLKREVGLNIEWYDEAASKESSEKLPKNHTDIIENAFKRFKDRVFEHGINLQRFCPKGAPFEPAAGGFSPEVTDVQVRRIGSSAQSTSSPEAYTINISEVTTADGKPKAGERRHAQVRISGQTVTSIIWAFGTLSQLFYLHTASMEHAWSACLPARIDDSPRFPFRGLMVDIARNWLSPTDISRTIEAMAACKLNRLHIHATDSQSWPVEIPSFPELSDKGAFSAEEVWTWQALRDVQTFGVYRGVEVFLEVDMPGHSGAVWHSHPDLVVAYNKDPWDKYALEPPAGQLKLNNPKVDSFVQQLLADLLPRATLHTSIFHIGGDEINRESYALDPGVTSSAEAEIAPHLQKFIDKMLGILEQHAITPHVWQDMLLDWDLKFPANTVFHAWRAGGLEAIVEKGCSAIFGEAEEWYLDVGLGTFLDPDIRKRDPGVKYPYHDWLPPYKNWRRILAYDPLKHVPQDKHHLVLGGEVRLWGELTDSVNLDGMLWPRAAAAAEVMWNGKRGVGEEATRDLAVWRERVVRMGVAAGVVQMRWALQNRGKAVL